MAKKVSTIPPHWEYLPSTIKERLTQRRINRFARLVERKGLIAFEDIADWSARKPRSLERDERLREQAYRDLIKSVLSGEFGLPTKLRVAFLPRQPIAPPGRLSLRLQRFQIDLPADSVPPAAMCRWLWTFRDLADRWLAARGLDPLPLPPRTAPNSAQELKRPTRGRPATYNWTGVKGRLEEYATKEGPVEALEELIQKCTDFATDLHPRHRAPGEKTVRDAIKKHLLDQAARGRGK